MALTAKKVYAILKRQISDMEAKLNSPVRYRGTVATADLLPLNPDIGDMYNIESKSVYGEAGMNVAWNGVVWDTMGAPIDMSLYIKSSELADWVKQQNKPTYTAEEVGALPADTKIPSKTSDLQNDSGFLTKIPDNYLSGTDKTLSVSGKAADAKTVGDKNVELLANILSKLDKNQGSENFGKIAGINESGDIVPMFPVSVDYNEETNCLEFGSDQKMELNKGINLDSTLTKTGYAADAGTVGEITNSLKEDISTKITKFYASNQGETHLADSDDGKIQDMIIYGKSSQDGVPTPENPVEIKSVVNPTVKIVGKNLLKATLQTTTKNGVTCTANGDGTYTLNGTATATDIFILHSNIDFTGQMRLCGGTSLVFLQYSNSSNFAYEDKGTGIIIEHFDSVTYPNASFNILIKANNVYNNVLVKPMITTDLTATYDDFEPYHEQIVTLPYTLNAIPVESGGNVTIDGQQYIADYVDVERGKLVRMVGEFDTKVLTVFGISETDGVYRGYFSDSMLRNFVAGNSFRTKLFDGESTPNATRQYSVYMNKNNKGQWLNFICDSTYRETADLKSFIQNTGTVYGIFETSEEIDLTQEEITAFKALATYYPTTNISINSEQLDGYTVFNYPISMENGWNYVKQQIGDTRDYIYNMDARTQDTDLQAAEAYVNSEYAVALTELEV